MSYSSIRAEGRVARELGIPSVLQAASLVGRAVPSILVAALSRDTQRLCLTAADRELRQRSYSELLRAAHKAAAFSTAVQPHTCSRARRRST